MKLRRIGRLYSAELTKTWRTRFPYLGLLASALMALIARQSIETMSGEIIAASYLTASINMAATLIIPIFATIFAAMAVASESYRGTLRTVLTRPVTRAEFLTAKLALALTYLVFLFAANLIPALLIAQNYPLFAPGDDPALFPGAVEQGAIYAAAIAITFLPLAATVCFGFAVSALSSNPATAIGVAVGILLSIEPLKHIGNVGLETWFVSSYYATATGTALELTQRISGASWTSTKIFWLYGISALTAAVFLATSYASFLRRDLTA